MLCFRTLQEVTINKQHFIHVLQQDSVVCCFTSIFQKFVLYSQDGSLQCPTCKAIHGVKHGIQPKEGNMDVRRLHQSLPGHPDCGMITITYDFGGGIQACRIQTFAFTEKRVTYP